jgi:histidyl-tRNA synthetase
LGKQLKLADSRRVKAVVVIGPDDRARGQVGLKDLSAGSQRAVDQSALPAALQELGCATG